MGKKRVPTNSRKMPRKKRRRISPFLVILCFLLSIAALALVAYLIFQLIVLDMFPLTLLIPMVSVIVLLTLMIILFSNFKCRRQVSKLFMTLLLAVLTVGYGFGNYYVYGLTHLFNEVTNLTDKVAHRINVYALKGSGIDNAKDLDGLSVGIVPSLNEDGIQRCISDLESNDVSIDVYDYYTLSDLLYGFYSNQVDTIILDEAYEYDIHEMGGEYTNFGTSTVNVHQTVYYTDRSESQNESLNRVSSIVSDPFTVLISGNDSYGSLNENSRSDVNMLVTINPATHTVLMTSIPRDLYVTLVCPEGAEACPADTLNKLTHSGLYGVASTDETIENLLEIPVNYTVRVNFSSLVNLVDAVGGIDVYIEEGLEVDTFYANGTQGVQAGWNHLEGERALAFARERYAYTDGDNQRVKNQQIVLEALINKIASPSMLLNFGDFIDALGGAFETNMPADQIRSFIRYQFAMMPDWKFENFSIVGEVGTEYCTIQGDYASVMIPYMEYVDAAKEKIQAVLDGDSSESVESPTTDLSQLTLWDFSEYSTNQSYYEDPNLYTQDSLTEYDDSEYYEYDEYGYDYEY